MSLYGEQHHDNEVKRVSLNDFALAAANEKNVFKKSAIFQAVEMILGTGLAHHVLDLEMQILMERGKPNG